MCYEQAHALFRLNTCDTRDLHLQVVANVSGNALFSGGSNFVPIGGHIMAHASATRLELKKKGRSCNRKIKIVCSPLLPERDAEFSVGAQGIDSAV